MKYTANLNLKKPEGTDNVNIDDLNSNFDTLDAAIAGKEPAITNTTSSDYWSGNKTFRNLATDVRAIVLTGLSTATNAVISATDTFLSALGKLQKQISDHAANVSNPHTTTKSQVGLGNVVNVDTTVAGNITITDAGSIIISTNVEGALQEAFTNINTHKADNVKQMINLKRKQRMGVRV